MDFIGKTTDELVEIIVNELGVKLPYYDYEYKTYVSVIPSNVDNVSGAMGIEYPEMQDTFRDACTYIIESITSSR